MSRYHVAQLERFRANSHCPCCVHYLGCRLWLAMLLVNEERTEPGLEFLVPDISGPCAMFVKVGRRTND
jgi:hypothetical protein